MHQMISRRSTSSSRQGYTMHCSGALTISLLGGQLLRRTGPLGSPASWAQPSAGRKLVCVPCTSSGTMMGEKIRTPITKNNLNKTRKAALQDVLKLQGNRSSLRADAIWSVFAPGDGFEDIM